MELTISGNNKADLLEVEKLAKKLGLNVEKNSPVKPKRGKDELLKVMREKAAEGGVLSFEDPDVAIAALKELGKMNAFKEINDPVEWQKQLRKDRIITGRND